MSFAAARAFAAAFCIGTADDPQCPQLPGCLSSGGLISGDSSISLCIPSCDPLAQDCAQGLACYWANNDFNCIFTSQDLPLGEVCGYINDCVVGAACTAAEYLPDCAGEACCSAFCDVGALEDPCPELLPGTSCESFFEQGDDPNCAVGLCVASP